MPRGRRTEPAERRFASLARALPPASLAAPAAAAKPTCTRTGTQRAVLGAAGAPLPAAPPASLRDRLRREYAVAPPPAINRDLPELASPLEDVGAARLALMRQEIATRMGVMMRIMGRAPPEAGGPMFSLPAGDPAPVQPASETAHAWTGGRSTDVVVAVPAKSGTTWAMHICHQLRARAAPVDFDCQMDVMTWLECGYGMYGHNADADQAAEPRVIKSHLPFAALPAGTNAGSNR
jgi:hypothetical protein